VAVWARTKILVMVELFALLVVRARAEARLMSVDLYT
jgi:hypothetical protein